MNFNDQFSTPILIIFWRRPEAISKVIASLRKIKPTQLFLACDGPRDGNEEEMCKVLEARKQAESGIDWPCTVQTRYSAVNQGLKYGEFNAMDWFFSHVEEGIILEDDTLPDSSFFYFCREMLERYRHDTRVWQVTGNNFIEEASPEGVSYLFCSCPTTWGWASWRRCWRLYDIDMKSWPEIRSRGSMANAFDSKVQLDYWSKIWNSVTEYDYPSTWDYQWIYACFSNSGLSIVPTVNLVTNIGFGPDGVNCLDENHQNANLPARSLDTLVHPRLVLRDRSYDRVLFEKIYEPQAGYKHTSLDNLWLKLYFTAKGLAGKFIRADAVS
jgi:hypothetical protein